MNDLVIPEGMRVLVPIIILHHSKAFWEDPEVFRPERYLYFHLETLCTFSFSDLD